MKKRRNLFHLDFVVMRAGADSWWPFTLLENQPEGAEGAGE